MRGQTRKIGIQRNAFGINITLKEAERVLPMTEEEFLKELEEIKKKKFAEMNGLKYVKSEEGDGNEQSKM